MAFDYAAPDRQPVDVPPHNLPGRFVMWHGEATGSWWALFSGRDGFRLLEAASEQELAATINWHLQMRV